MIYGLREDILRVKIKQKVSLMTEHLLKRIKQFRIVYLKSGLQDFRLSEGKHQNNGGGSKVTKKW